MKSSYQVDLLFFYVSKSSYQVDLLYVSKSSYQVDLLLRYQVDLLS